MNLQRVEPFPAFWTFCVRCGKRTASENLYADLDGPPFVAYYCEPCKGELVSTGKAGP